MAKQHKKPALDLSRELAARGLRLTAQRRLLLQTLVQAGRPLDARALIEEARRTLPKLERTTVYRTLSLLKAHGLIDELDLLHQKGSGHFYEPVPLQQELHLVCLQCGRVIEAASEHWVPMRRELERKEGFRVKTARLELGGTCRRCHERAKR